MLRQNLRTSSKNLGEAANRVPTMAINAPQIGTRPRRNEEEVRKLQSFPRIQWKRRSKERRELSSLIPTRTPMRACESRSPPYSTTHVQPPCGRALPAIPHVPQLARSTARSRDRNRAICPTSRRERIGKEPGSRRDFASSWRRAFWRGDSL